MKITQITYKEFTVCESLEMLARQGKMGTYEAILEECTKTVGIERVPTIEQSRLDQDWDLFETFYHEIEPRADFDPRFAVINLHSKH